MNHKSSRAKLWLGMVFVVAVGGYAAYRFSVVSTSSRVLRVRQLDKSIQTELPVKATSTQVTAWFQRHKIGYISMGGKKFKLNEESFVVESGIPVENIGNVVTGGFSIPAEEIFENNCRINITFFMDKNNKTIKHQVGWDCSGF